MMGLKKNKLYIPLRKCKKKKIIYEYGESDVNTTNV